MISNKLIKQILRITKLDKNVKKEIYYKKLL